MTSAPPAAPSAGHAPASSARPGLRLAVAVLAAVMLAGSIVAAVRWWPRTGYAIDCLAVGAHVLDPDGELRTTDTAAFLAARDRLGAITVRRSFDPSLPASFADSAAGADAAAGVRSFVSWKPPGGDYRGAARGDYDREVRAWARSVPDTGVFATAFHEPENDMTAADFVALQRHLYAVVKAANPTIRWGPVYMAYWWDPAAAGHYIGDPAAWWPGRDAADFSGFDWYGPQPEPMTGTAEFEHWHTFMAATGVPLFITEYGQYAVRPGEPPRPDLQRQRAVAIEEDAAWIGDHPQIRMWNYWDGTGAQGDWRLTDVASQSAWQAVARSGCTG